MHAAVFAAAEQGRARLEGGAAVGVRGTWENKTHAHNDMNAGFFQTRVNFKSFEPHTKKVAASDAELPPPFWRTWRPRSHKHGRRLPLPLISP